MTTYNVYSYREFPNGEISLHLQLGAVEKESAMALYNKRVNSKHRKATWIVIPNTEQGNAKFEAWLTEREKILAPRREKFDQLYAIAHQQIAKGKRFGGDIAKYYRGEYDIITT